MKETNEDKIYVKIGDEVNDNYSDDDLYNITSWGADLSFRELIARYEEGELVKPEIQRNYIWDKSEASRFIESILMGLPVPSIFLAKKGDQHLIVDGYQRIMTIFDFKRGIFSKDESVFKLANSNKINLKWRGKAFSQLNQNEQRRILTTTIHAIIFEQRKPENSDTSLYQVFERINTSGRSLLPQEIRNCIYQGNLNSSLIKLNNNEKWRFLYGLEKPDSRMRDIEFILRFFTFSNLNFESIPTKQISLKRTLNLFMGDKENNRPEFVKKIKEEFDITISFIYEHLGKNAFHNISKKEDSRYVEKFHPTIFDSVMIATLYALKKNSNLRRDNLESQRLKLLQNEDYILYISKRTTNIEHIKGRISLALKYLYGMEYE